MTWHLLCKLLWGIPKQNSFSTLWPEFDRIVQCALLPAAFKIGILTAAPNQCSLGSPVVQRVCFASSSKSVEEVYWHQQFRTHRMRATQQQLRQIHNNLFCFTLKTKPTKSSTSSSKGIFLVCIFTSFVWNVPKLTRYRIYQLQITFHQHANNSVIQTAFLEDANDSAPRCYRAGNSCRNRNINKRDCY